MTCDVQVGPHEFQPLGRIFHRDKCRACLASKGDHPIDEHHPFGKFGPGRLGYVPARAIGDKRPPIKAWVIGRDGRCEP